MSHEKILIIEDDENVAESLEKSLISFDYTVAGVTSSGVNVLSMVKEMPLDLVLMDSVLKGPYEVITASFGILSLFDIPIIYIIPYDNEELIIRVKNRMPYGFLTKPVNEQMVRAIIRRALIYHAWGTVPTENVYQCYTMYKEVVCMFGNENGLCPSRSSEWMAY